MLTRLQTTCALHRKCLLPSCLAADACACLDRDLVHPFGGPHSLTHLSHFGARSERACVNMAIIATQTASHAAAPLSARLGHQPALRPAAAAQCSARHQHVASSHRVWSQPLRELHKRASLRCSAEPTDSIEPHEAPLPSAEAQNGGAAAPLGPRDDDVRVS